MMVSKTLGMFSIALALVCFNAEASHQDTTLSEVDASRQLTEEATN